MPTLRPTTVFLAVCAIAAWTNAVTRHPLIVVVSFDGFHPDYVQPNTTPNLFRFRNASASAPYLRPVFPTRTFVNHFTIATGLYPESHGVLDNYMFDRNNELMRNTYEQFHQDESVVPIWMQNEYSGNGRYSGVMMWPGSKFKYQGKMPTYSQIYDRTIPFNSRVDTIMSWVKNETRPANLVFAYFEEPDRTGHSKGIESQELSNQITRVDETVKYFLDRIKEEHLENKINLVILSDHGMYTITYNGLIDLDEYEPSSSYKSIITGPNAFILPNPEKFDQVYQNLTKGANTSGKFDVYKKNELPDYWHMKNTTRLNGIIYLVAKLGYSFHIELYESILETTTKEDFRVGVHGYDNYEPSMRAIFMASGPAFKKNFIIRPFDNIQLYPLISRVLHLDEPPSSVRPNGTTTDVESLLTKPSEWDGSESRSGFGSRSGSGPICADTGATINPSFADVHGVLTISRL